MWVCHHGMSLVSPVSQVWSILISQTTLPVQQQNWWLLSDRIGQLGKLKTCLWFEGQNGNGRGKGDVFFNHYFFICLFFKQYLNSAFYLNRLGGQIPQNLCRSFTGKTLELKVCSTERKRSMEELGAIFCGIPASLKSKHDLQPIASRLFRLTFMYVQKKRHHSLC